MLNEKKRLKLLNQFLNDSPLTRDFKVEVSSYSVRYYPKQVYMHIEDVEMLNKIREGATNFLYWLERNGYDIVKVRKKKGA